jgi:hypothetical protein
VEVQNVRAINGNASLVRASASSDWKSKETRINLYTEVTRKGTTCSDGVFFEVIEHDKTQSEEVRQDNIRVKCLTIEREIMSALKKIAPQLKEQITWSKA